MSDRTNNELDGTTDLSASTGAAGATNDAQSVANEVSGSGGAAGDRAGDDTEDDRDNPPGAETPRPSPNGDDRDDGASRASGAEGASDDVQDGTEADDADANDEESHAGDDVAQGRTPSPAPDRDDGADDDDDRRSIIPLRVQQYRVPDVDPDDVEPDAPDAPEPERVPVPFTPGRLGSHLAIVFDTLWARAAQLFVFGGAAVTVGPVGSAAAGRLAAPQKLTKSGWRVLLSQYIEFQKGNTKVPIDAPGPLLTALQEGPDFPFPNLRKVVHIPPLLPDGTVVDQPGYHAASETYYGPDPSFVMPRMLDAPTIEDAIAAVARYGELLVDALFKTPGALAAAIAAIITPLVRSAIDGAVPLFVADSAVSRIGKTELVNLVALLLTGRPAQVQPPVSPKELEKRITMAVKYGDLLFAIDNGVGQLGGPVLESLVTARVWIGRILGATEKLAGPIEFTLFYTGNHVEYHRDMLFRVVIIGLGTKLESPGERPLQRPDLQTYALQNRGSLIADAFTIVRAYMLADSPDMGLPAIHGFDSWSRVVRSALVWAGLSDPLTDVLQARRDADPETDAMGVVLEALAALFPPGVYFTAMNVQDRLRSPWGTQNGTDDATRRLADALEFLFHGKKPATMNPHSFGQHFIRLTDRTVGGLHLSRTNSAGKGNVFKMERIASK